MSKDIVESKELINFKNSQYTKVQSPRFSANLSTLVYKEQLYINFKKITNTKRRKETWWNLINLVDAMFFRKKNLIKHNSQWQLIWEQFENYCYMEKLGDKYTQCFALFLFLQSNIV